VYRPSNFTGSADNFPLPAPTGTYGTDLTALNGVAPGGTWKLYVMDDAAKDQGSITGGWELTITSQ
jgi:subtilisin-like proprotein convertase family protein